MVHIRVIMRLAAMTAVTLVGAGACAFDPQPGDSGGDRPQLAAGAGGETGASATPGPDQRESAPTVEASPTPAKPKPTATASPSRSSGTTTTAKTRAGCPVGEKQREVETHLARLETFGPVTVDGRQSAEDCAAIKKFQRRYGIVPAEGRAGPTTADVARRLAATDTDACDAGKGTTFCVDLTLQTVWAMRDGKVVMAPTVTRTGMAGGFQTDTGRFTVNGRNLSEWSRPYKVWLPYWQHFTRGMGFHETTTYIHDKSIGSHGCVNVLPRDARQLWELGKIGTDVHVFGRRPGT
ncbi:Putative peptidoglycan binding domain-containing protein [Micromonospora pattaloongensis]|uniref:Peptidoglycan binding domain-containing protein n=1 Tax=Micromonospora pattaloongensis TaxID=405436 RepID=A0A1H3SNL8_9ACTN|nr:L,D-transpeptidase family protein [Micromonospora pattaloongensis]SDZ38729.1 Putative peptidoglycan binding domain-containing protein [Micromonospora pattaloongensis]